MERCPACGQPSADHQCQARMPVDSLREAFRHDAAQTLEPREPSWQERAPEGFVVRNGMPLAVILGCAAWLAICMWIVG